MKNDTETKEQADAVIDSDIHVYPSDASPLKPFILENLQLALKLAMDTQPWNGYQNPHGINRRDVECLDAGDLARLHLDPLGIAYGVLQPQLGMRVGLINSSDVANQLSTAWIDWQHEYYISRDSRLLGSVCINIGDPEAVAQEITRAAGNFRFVLVVVPGESHLLYGHRFYDPIFSACEENNLVFALHPGQEGALGSSTPVRRPSSYFEWHSTLSTTYQAQLASMISEGLFERYRSLLLDEDAVRSNIRKLADVGVHGIVMAGSSGEFFTLSSEEYSRLARIVMEFPLSVVGFLRNQRHDCGQSLFDSTIISERQ